MTRSSAEMPDYLKLLLIFSVHTYDAVTMLKMFQTSNMQYFGFTVRLTVTTATARLGFVTKQHGLCQVVASKITEIIFMVAPCISDIKYIIVQLMHLT